jgi:hypothetical protein
MSCWLLRKPRTGRLRRTTCGRIFTQTLPTRCPTNRPQPNAMNQSQGAAIISTGIKATAGAQDSSRSVLRLSLPTIDSPSRPSSAIIPVSRITPSATPTATRFSTTLAFEQGRRGFSFDAAHSRCVSPNPSKGFLTTFVSGRGIPVPAVAARGGGILQAAGSSGALATNPTTLSDTRTYPGITAHEPPAAVGVRMLRALRSAFTTRSPLRFSRAIAVANSFCSLCMSAFFSNATGTPENIFSRGFQ